MEVVQLVKEGIVLAKPAFKWSKRQYDYIKHIDSNFDTLMEERRLLNARESYVRRELWNNRSTKEMTVECENWLTSVAALTKEIETLEYKHRNRPTYRPSYKLGKRIVKKTKEATNLRENLSNINIMQDKPASVPPSRRWNNDLRIVNHPSLENHVETLIQWLKDEKMKRICIWGAPGVGKTTIMKTLRGKLSESCNFEHVFYVTVSSEDIQGEIWKGLGMRMDENNHRREREDLISKKLEKKKYLLLLDEVSSTINLEEVGIHSDHTNGKVVFVSRDKYSGHTDEDINVRSLSEKDAQKLFWNAVGSDPENMGREFRRLGESIIKLCGGMPFILLLIGKHLARRNEQSLWRAMKLQLQSPSTELWQQWEEYYRSFDIVYDNLDDNHKPCLLHWAIFPFCEEINRDYIIDCWTGQKLLEHPTLSETRDRGHGILRSLVDKSLLEKGEKLGHFKMFIGFQRAALRIANLRSQLSFVVENDKRIKPEEWIQAKRVSLARISLLPLPDEPKCRGMLTLLLHENSLTEFPGQFFRHMSDLQVLGLKTIGVGGLPASISALQNLRGLFLENCSQLVHLPCELGDLQNLQILVVHHTGIYSLPIDIGRLTNLKCLRVSFKEVDNQQHVTAANNNTANCANSNGTEGMMIPAKIFDTLSNLEELSIDVSPNIRRWNVNADEIARRISLLEELTHLLFYFPRLESFEYFIQNSKSWKANREGFRSFSICVGQQGNNSTSEFSVFDCSVEKHLKFSEGSGNGFAVVSEVLQQANSFELIRHNAAHYLPADELQELEACIVEECNAMQTIVNASANTGGAVVFQRLRKLHMRKLPNLKSIWEGAIASTSFGSLTTLTLKECNRIKKLFSVKMVSQLPNLQILQVEECEKIEKIIEADDTESANFPELKNFQLCSLQSLSSICDVPLNLPSLETLLIKTCETLNGLPEILLKAPGLKQIQCTEDCWHRQRWPNNETEERFRTLHRDPL